MDRFEMTVDGYLAAKQYLLDIGKYFDFLNFSQSTDGFSLVAYANDLAEKEDGKTDC